MKNEDFQKAFHEFALALDKTKPTDQKAFEIVAKAVVYTALSHQPSFTLFIKYLEKELLNNGDLRTLEVIFRWLSDAFREKINHLQEVKTYE